MNKIQPKLFAFTVIGVIIILLVVTLSSNHTASKQVNFQQSILYKNAILNSDYHKSDSLNKIMNKKTKIIGVTMIQRELKVIDIDEENNTIEDILNN